MICLKRNISKYVCLSKKKAQKNKNSRCYDTESLYKKGQGTEKLQKKLCYTEMMTVYWYLEIKQMPLHWQNLERFCRHGDQIRNQGTEEF